MINKNELLAKMIELEASIEKRMVKIEKEIDKIKYDIKNREHPTTEQAKG